MGTWRCRALCAVGRELLRRGHDVQMAVPPDQVGFAESAGLAAVACGPDSRAAMDVVSDSWRCYFDSPGGSGT